MSQLFIRVQWAFAALSASVGPAVAIDLVQWRVQDGATGTGTD